MKTSHRMITIFLMAMLASCNGLLSTPAPPDTTNMLETVLATVGTSFAETQRAIPTVTPTLPPTLAVDTTTPTASSTPTPTPTALIQVSAEPAIPISEHITYYYFVSPEKTILPEGSVNISITYILAPTSSGIPYGSNTASDLRAAIDTALHDDRNGWTSTGVKIINLKFKDGHAIVDLLGDYYGVGDVTLIAARMQILMTIFANPSVQTATVTLNGNSIGNLGISNSAGAKPIDYVYTRDEIEVFMSGDVYVVD